jgi:MinD-like ATPase involved in chromosome partitioning or flagellar assembly
MNTDNLRISPVTVATALGFMSWEPEFIGALRHPSVGMSVTRRCFDCVDLLAYAQTTKIDGVLIDAELPGLDADVIARLHLCDLWVLVTVSAERAVNTWTLMGADFVVVIDEKHVAASARAVVEATRRAVPMPQMESEGDSRARSICVWGPPGSNGRSTVAIAIADEVARRGISCALVDADTTAPAIDQLLGISQSEASIGWAQRLAARGELSRRVLLDAMPVTRAGVRLLLGSVVDNHLRPALWSKVLAELTSAVEVIVSDVGAIDTMESDNSYSHRTMLTESDVVVVVASADPVGTARLMRMLATAKDIGVLANSKGHLVVALTHLNVRDSDGCRFVAQQVEPVVDSLGGVIAVIDDDATVCRQSRRLGRTIAEVAPKSQIRRDLQSLSDFVLAAA